MALSAGAHGLSDLHSQITATGGNNLIGCSSQFVCDDVRINAMQFVTQPSRQGGVRDLGKVALDSGLSVANQQLPVQFLAVQVQVELRGVFPWSKLNG